MVSSDILVSMIATYFICFDLWPLLFLIAHLLIDVNFSFKISQKHRKLLSLLLSYCRQEIRCLDLS